MKRRIEKKPTTLFMRNRYDPIEGSKTPKRLNRKKGKRLLLAVLWRDMQEWAWVINELGGFVPSNDWPYHLRF